MSENLKVNANSSVLEHKRKHNLLIEALGLNEDGKFKILENILDNEGHPRFIEGNGTPGNFISQPFCKYSLSGTHLMFVVAGLVEPQTIGANEVLGNFLLPEWIASKIYPVWGNINLQRIGITFTAGDWSTKVMDAIVYIDGNYLKIANLGTDFVLEKSSGFRVQFDLLIDNE